MACVIVALDCIVSMELFRSVEIEIDLLVDKVGDNNGGFIFVKRVYWIVYAKKM